MTTNLPWLLSQHILRNQRLGLLLNMCAAAEDIYRTHYMKPITDCRLWTAVNWVAPHCSSRFVFLFPCDSTNRRRMCLCFFFFPTCCFCFLMTPLYFSLIRSWYRLSTMERKHTGSEKSLTFKIMLPPLTVNNKKWQAKLPFIHFLYLLTSALRVWAKHVFIKSSIKSSLPFLPRNRLETTKRQDNYKGQV